ncbi:Flocculation suppression protein [Coemansia sp. RSA 1813]|nr:Flocculation suppression protein [Coemansia sp. RSA 1646]KAJ2213072.1 Flocculation suppression protein [Coemansia sp. RSA 487]KAJ2567232.1 Flocculation suppression protein [Coemansia sp. RSA 1813]
MADTPPPPIPASSSEGDAATALAEEKRQSQQAETSADAFLPEDGNSSAEKKPRLLIQKTHAAFVSKLYAMVADRCTDALIAWSSEGDSFKVTDPAEFARKVLPVYFKHGNWQSFVRQLNMYGFHKISDLAYGGIFGDAQLWMFKHYYFRRGELKLLQNIKRRGPKVLARQELSQAASAASPGSTSEPPSSANEQPNTAPATPTLSSSSAQPPPLLLPVTATASALPSPNEATANSSGFCMDDYVANLKRNIADLQQFNTQLHHENQAMRAKITDVQGAFAGIMGFLETAIVQPATRQAHGAETVPPVVDAFRKLASDIAPALSCCSERQGCINPASGFLSPAPFRVKRFRPQQSDSCHDYQHNNNNHHHRHHRHHSSSNSSSSTHRHNCSCSCSCSVTLPPIRPGCCAEPSPFARIPSLSPPSQEPSALDTICYEPPSFSHHRRARRSSSSSSSGSSTILDGGSGEQKDMQSTLPSQVDWARQPYSSHLESSLRETLPAKRPRIQ